MRIKNIEKKVFIAALLFSFLLIPLYLLGIYVQNRWGIQSIFQLLDMDGEANLIAWYSSTLLLLSSLSLFFIADKTKNRKERITWLGFSALFAYLSLDEIASIHNSIGSALNTLFIEKYFSADLNGFPWIFLGLPAVLLVLYAWKKIPRAQPKKAQRLIMFAFTCFILAILCEAAGAALFLTNAYGANIATRTEVIIEETLELAGMSSFLYAFLLILKEKASPKF